MATAADYLGRTFDICALQGLGSPSAVRLPVTPAQGHSSGIIVGVAKLVQRVLYLFFTRQGSVAGQPSAGCGFLADAQTGEWRTPLNVTQSFYAALPDVQRQAVAAETDADPDDERFGSAELVSVSFAGTEVSIGIKIASRAGSSAKVIQALSTLVRM